MKMSIIMILMLIIGVVVGYIATASFYSYAPTPRTETMILYHEKTYTSTMTTVSIYTNTLYVTQIYNYTSYVTRVFNNTQTFIVTTVPKIGAGDQMVIAWMLSTCNRSYKDLILRYRGVIDVVSPDWYYLSEDLGVGAYTSRCAEDQSFINDLRSNNISLMPMVVSANADRVRSLITDLSKIYRFANILIDKAKRFGYIGYNIDFEVSLPDNSGDFAYFIDVLSKLMHENNLILTVDVPGKRTEWPSSYTMTYDYEKLGKTSVDVIILMAYDFYEWSGVPKPIAPIWWVKDVVDYALKYIPREKLVLGIPNYGSIWSSTGSRVKWLLYQDWKDLSSKYGYTTDESVMERKIVLPDGSVAYYVDGEMTFYRALIAVDKKIKGIAVWRLDEGDPSTWRYISIALGKTCS